MKGAGATIHKYDYYLVMKLLAHQSYCNMYFSFECMPPPIYTVVREVMLNKMN